MSRFEQFLGSTHWVGFESHLERGQTDLRLELRENVRREFEIRQRLKHKLLSDYADRVHTVTPAERAWARAELDSNVVAIDGTRAHVELLSGTRSQLGIVAVNYQNDKASYVTYVTEMTYNDFDPSEDVEDIIAARHRDERTVSDLVIRGALSYNERLRALDQKATWRFVHGELFPFELRSGLGKLEALPIALALFRNISAVNTIGSVVSDTTSTEINYGYALEPFQYFIFCNLKYEYDKWLENAKFNPSDKELFQEFINDTASQYVKGVYRVGPRPYMFYAHKERCAEFAALLCEDSATIPERGFPLLVDYADTVCANLFRAGDFEKRIFNELALEGDLLAELSERASRKR